jgi:hypothetical protein
MTRTAVPHLSRVASPHCVAFLAAGVCLAAYLTVPAATAHEAVSGWSYPTACCSNHDCREVQETEVGEMSRGYVIQGTGEVVAYSDPRIRQSPDGVYHWCSVAGANDTRTICLFVPPKSF